MVLGRFQNLGRPRELRSYVARVSATRAAAVNHVTIPTLAGHQLRLDREPGASATAAPVWVDVATNTVASPARGSP